VGTGLATLRGGIATQIGQDHEDQACQHRTYSWNRKWFHLDPFAGQIVRDYGNKAIVATPLVKKIGFEDSARVIEARQYSRRIKKQSGAASAGMHTPDS
jgi:hypothetical protein